MPKRKGELNEKQKRFCEEYIIDLNATQAAIRADYSKKTAYSAGQRMLKNVEIQGYISKLKQKRSEKTNITQEMVLKELAHMAFDDIKNYLKFGMEKKENGQDSQGNTIYTYEMAVKLKDSNEIDTRNINEIRLDKEGQLKFKLYSKENALQLLGRHLGMFKDRLEHSGEIKIDDPFADMSTEDLKKLMEDD